MIRPHYIPADAGNEEIADIVNTEFPHINNTGLGDRRQRGGALPPFPAAGDARGGKGSGFETGQAGECLPPAVYELEKDPARPHRS